jgi:hypothetical protein
LAGPGGPDPPGAPASAGAGSPVLRLVGGRFAVTAFWQLPGGPVNEAAAVPISDRAGAFWFFAPRNLEVVVRMVDGRAENGHFGVFAGGMTGVATLLVVTDTATGEARTYSHPAGAPASVGDPAAFPATP